MAKKNAKSNIIFDVLKVADINHTSVSTATRNFLLNRCTESYRDMELTENLYNLDSIIESIDDPVDGFANPNKSVISELNKIHKAASKKNCAYIRITFL